MYKYVGMRDCTSVAIGEGFTAHTRTYEELKESKLQDLKDSRQWTPRNLN